MAKIPLRVYTKEIENLIERGEIEQAVANAKNILKYYPKHIDTYRLLGKAFLESQRYGEAADILQRVLSVLPDDFISQIGMSIIREDEGGLDAAIWHMERAYEVQPFNPAVQDELRRLYGRRDGIEPPKIRLTRGALVRMYARGELYPQAIAEIRAALADDPQRMDLLVLLARLYYQSGHKNDSAETCSEILHKLPYCFEANQLLAEYLPTTNRAEEAQKFLQRINALDPYFAFISPTTPTSSQVPDQAVMVEQFSLESGEDPQTPEWTRVAGVDWKETEEEALPDWLNTLKPDVPPAQTSSLAQSTKEPTPPAESLPADEPDNPPLAENGLIPDWMQEKGWTASGRKADEIMASQPEADEIAPGEIPDWVQSIAPPQAGQVEQEQERTDWLETILSQTNGKDNSITLPPSTTTDPGLEVGQPAWNAEGVSGIVDSEDTPPQSESALSDLPDWLRQMEEEQQPGAESGKDRSAPEFESTPTWSQMDTPPLESPASAETPTTGDDMDWLQALTTETQPPDAGTEQMPDWLQSLSTEETPAAASSLTADQLPEWLTATEPAEPVGPAAELPAETAPEPPLTIASSQAETIGATELDSGMAWLESVAAKHDAENNVLDSYPEQSLGQPLESDDQAASLPEPVSSETTPIEAPGQTEPEGQLEPIDTSAPQVTDMDAAMAWLESLAAKQGADEATLVTPPEQRIEQPPEWVTREMDAQQPTEEISAQAVESLASELEPSQQAEPTAPNGSEMDAAMAWLESLAAKQGADEATLVTPLEQRLDQPPEWVTKEMESDAVASPVETGQLTNDLQGAEGLTEADLAPAEAAVLPDWLSEALPNETLFTSKPAETTESAVAVETESPVESKLAEASASETDFGSAAGIDSATEFDSDFAWLESLAEKQGAQEGTLITSPEDRQETPPAWVIQTPAPAADRPADIPPQNSPQVEQFEDGEPVPQMDLTAQAEQSTAETQTENAVPDWLQNVEAENQPAIPGEGETNQEAEIPAWLASIAQEEPAQTDLAGNALPWRMEEPQGVLEETPAEEAVPDWFKEVEAPQSIGTAPSQPEAIPDWLKNLDEEPVNDGFPGETEMPTSSAEFQSTWEPEAEYNQSIADRLPAAKSQEAPSTHLTNTQNALKQGNLELALTGYNTLIQNGQHLPETIYDLRDALYRYPVDIDIWQTLGDAYSRNNQLQEALDAYTKAEELLR